MRTEEINDLEKICKTVDEEFGSLTGAQLNWKPSPEKWSIAQCLSHLIVSNKTYFPAIERIKMGKKLSFWERNNPLANYTGKKMLSTLGANVRKKFRAPKIFLPSNSVIPPSIIQNFSRHQEQLIGLISEMSEEQLELARISSPVASLITLNLSDAIRILIIHEQRHLQQAIRVKEDKNFIQ